MKRLLLVFILACTPTVFCADTQREIAKKEVTEHFPSVEAAVQRTHVPLPYKQWLDFVTFPGWQLLGSTETDEYYFALFRSDDYLIFWHADRKLPSAASRSQTSTEIIAKDGGRVVWEKPSKWASIEYRLEYPGGAILGTDQCLAFKIKDDFHDQLVLEFTRQPEKNPSQRLFRQEVTWAK